MIITHDSLQNMNEADLRQHVLIPLLQRMGFHNVREYHGGSLERGKDIVCWKLNETGERENYAMVVKATKLSGRAGVTNRSIGEVRTQIEQCFGESYLDASSGKHEEVQRVWVVSNQLITKEAAGALNTALKSVNLHRNVSFVDIDKLWEFVKEHLNGIYALAQLRDAGEILNKLHPDVQIRATVEGESIGLSIAKLPGGDAPIVRMSASSTDPEVSQQVQTAMDQLFRRGEPAEFSGEQVQVSFPEQLQQVLLPPGMKLQSVRLMPAPAEASPLVLRIEIACADGSGTALEYVELHQEKGGRDEVTLTNKRQPLGFDITLVISRPDSRWDLTIAPRQVEPAPPAVPVIEAYREAELVTCMNLPAKISVYEHFTGIRVFQCDSTLTGDRTYPDGVLEMLADLVAVQRRTNLLIAIPMRGLTADEMEGIAAMRQILHNGKVTSEWDTLELTVPQSHAEAWLRSLLDEDLIVERDAILTVLGTEIPLGATRANYGRVRVTDPDAFLKQCESGSPDTNIAVTVVPIEAGKVDVDVLDWQVEGMQA